MLRDLKLSLQDLLGEDYCAAIAKTAKVLHGLSEDRIKHLLYGQVHCYSEAFAAQQEALTDKIGERIFDEFFHDNRGAATQSFNAATNLQASPIGGIGGFRVGEDGRLYLISKSEHYHTPMGHNFVGYHLIDKARELGISNATHNNTRGYITRTLEREIIRTVNGIGKGDNKALQNVIESTDSKSLNRVINLETGSLAVEAGIKMMLTRFYKLDDTEDTPEKSGKVPVFFVMADNLGGKVANYHGTTVIAQTFRGMWPQFYAANDANDIYKVVSIKINDAADLQAKIQKYNSGKYATAGFLHEIVLMNYGGIRLTKEFLKTAYALCDQFDTPTLADEIQSCMWYAGMYLHRQYDLQPDFVILGKGFSGGEYPASKIVTTAQMDRLSQFGALVTNGQQELASLSYLITMAFAEANSSEIHDANEYLEKLLGGLKERHSDVIDTIEGIGHLTAIHFKDVETTVRFTDRVNEMCIDISAQTYKADCPPAALLKPPLILCKKSMDRLVQNLDDALLQIK